MNPALKPHERILLTVAVAALERGEAPEPAVTSICIMALARLDGRVDDGYQPIEQS